MTVLEQFMARCEMNAVNDDRSETVKRIFLDFFRFSP